MMNYNERGYILASSRQGAATRIGVCLFGMVTHLLGLLLGLARLLLYHDILNQPTAFLGVFSLSGGASSPPQHPLIFPNGKRSRRARESTSAYSKATSQMSFQAIHTVMGAIVDIGGVFGEWT